jgi:hypothetical protein
MVSPIAQVNPVSRNTEQQENNEEESNPERGSVGAWLRQMKKVHPEFKWCCKYYHYEASNCIVMKTHVFKRYGSKMESTVTAIPTGCVYEDRSCAVDNGMLVWEVEKQSECRYVEWTTSEGKYQDGYYVSDQDSIALTFLSVSQTTTNTCDGEELYATDQGIMVKFLSDIPSNFSAISDKVSANYHYEAPAQLDTAIATAMTVASAMIQRVARQTEEIVKEAFWKNYLYSCRALSEYLEVMKGLILAHPTVSIRRILKNPNVFAKAGANVIEVYSCTPLNTTQFRLLPMNDSCTEYVPIEFD